MKLSTKRQQLMLLLASSAVTVGMSAGVAAAKSVSSITMVLVAPPGSFTSHAPFMGTVYGSFSASITAGGLPDTGTLTAQAVLPAPPPEATQIETFRMLTSTNPVGSLRLHCSEIVTPANNVTPPESTRGTCAVLHASGVFAGLTGEAKLTGLLETNVSPAQLTDTIIF